MELHLRIWKYMCFITIILINLFGLPCTVAGSEAEPVDKDTELLTSLFSNYQSGKRPSCGNGEAVQVKIGLAIRQIIDLNEPRQILEINVWIRLQWKDCHLTWNATAAGVKSLTVPNGKVWVPDITLYDNAIDSSAENELGGFTDYRQTIYPDGTVYYNFPSVLKSLCKVDVTYFPWDIQQCKLKFGSWAHHGWDLNISATIPEGDTSSYMSNGEWAIVGVPAVRHELMYGCCPEPYPDVTFYVQLERLPLFYLLNLMFPCMLISSMALLGFLLPPDSGEKVSLEITVLLSLAVFLLVVSETMPPTSETFPFIGTYFAVCMLLVSFSCLMTVFVLNIHFKGGYGKKVPACLRSFFLNFLGRLLRVTNEATEQEQSDYYNMNRHFYENNAYESYNSPSDLHPSTNGIVVHENNVRNSLQELKEMNMRNHKPADFGSSNDILQVLQKQCESLNEINVYIRQKKKLENSVSEWQKIAKVIDRLFLILFTLIHVGTAVGIILRIANADTVKPLEFV